MAAYRRVDDLWSPAGWVPRISSAPSARYRVWEAFTFYFTGIKSTSVRVWLYESGVMWRQEDEDSEKPKIEDLDEDEEDEDKEKNKDKKKKKKIKEKYTEVCCCRCY